MIAARNDYLNSVRNRRLKIQILGIEQNDSPTATRHQVLSSKFFTSLVITTVIIIAQLLLFHFYVGIDTNSFRGSSDEVTFNKLLEKEWKCVLSRLAYIYDIAYRFDLELVIIDPDVLALIERLESPEKQPLALSFTGPTKRTQESSHKSIVHLAAINETSGGQPNLKLFFNALKHNGYVTIKYVETGQRMQPEVYSRESHLFDDMLQDSLLGHKHSHDSNRPHENKEQDTKQTEMNDEKISKIYTEFISHLFILNHTAPILGPSNDESSLCKNEDSKIRSFVVIHIFILYNYEFTSLSSKWMQSGLVLDELDKHKLLSYNVHSFDFKIPLEHYRIHPKKRVISILQPSIRNKKSLERFQVFEPKNDRTLSFVNNSFIHCEPSRFNISGLRGRTQRMSKYLNMLDTYQSIPIGNIHSLVQEQLLTALQFMDVFSSTYGNFSYWLTGSTLLSYYKYCDLVSIPKVEVERFVLVNNESGKSSNSSLINDTVFNVELGAFSDEVSEHILNDLAESYDIGITMLSDWRKSYIPVTFQLKEAAQINLILYLYERRKDFYQYYYITRSTMTMSHRFTRKLPVYSNNKYRGHHVFSTSSLELCWTRVQDLNPFRVPCNVYDHLRRIYVI